MKVSFTSLLLLILALLTGNVIVMGNAEELESTITEEETEESDAQPVEDEAPPDTKQATGVDVDGDGTIDGYDLDGDGKIDDIEPESGFGKVDEADGYEWPTIFEEADDMLDVALLMYPIAELRQKARDTPEIFSDASAVLKEPITAREVGAMLTENRHVLVEMMEESATKVLEEVLDAIVERQKKAMDENNSKRQVTATLVNFADDNSQSELVYAVGVDNARRRVTVAFRGSVSVKDYLQDMQIWMEKIDNPLRHIRGQPKKIRIHHGFYEYLFYETTSGDKRADGTPKSKYERILDQAKVLLKKYPGYRLFVTGHSLGAALASLFAFMASTDEEVPGPVTCVGVASPFVGGTNFKKAFQHQEKECRLRYLRIVNKSDLITLMPFFALNLGTYKHVGVELKLYGERYTMRYPKRWDQWNAFRRLWSTSLLNNLSTQYSKNHSPSEYDVRLEATKKDLYEVYLNELYEDAKVVGSAIAKPVKK